MPQWCIMVVPIEHGPAINRLFNVINGDEGDNVSIPLSPLGYPDPATHLGMSRPLTDAQKARYPYSKTAPWSLPAPHTWPLDGGVTAQDVSDAVQSAITAVLEDPEDEGLPGKTFALISEATGLKRAVSDEL